MRQWLTKLESRGGSAARLVALCGMLGLVTFVLVTIFDVLMRWLFNSPIHFIADVAPLTVAIVVAAFFPFSIVERHHVTIELLGGMLGRRTRVWLDVFVAFVSLIFFALVAWQITLHTIDLHERGQTTWVVQIPSAPWWVVVSLFMMMCVVVQLNILLVQLWRALGERETDEIQSGLPEDLSLKNGE